MRVERQFTIDELAERLALSRSTIYYWGESLNIDPADIRVQRKSNSNQLNGRVWRSRHGVLTVRVCETLLRARMQAWMDRIRAEWQ